MAKSVSWRQSVGWGYCGITPQTPSEDKTGNGALNSTASVIAGSGLTQSLGNGALNSTDATIAGSGRSAHVGTGDLNSTDSVIAGSGISIVYGNGALLASASSIAGSGDAGAPPVTLDPNFSFVYRPMNRLRAGRGLL